MKKVKLYYFLTLGIGYLIAKNKAKKLSTTTNDKLTISDNIPFEVMNLIEAIGGKNNFIECNSTINSLKIVLRDVSKVNKEKIKSIGAKGIMVSENYITCIFGDYSKKLASLLQENINK